MESMPVQDFDSRMSVLEETFSKVNEKLSDLEERRGSEKGGEMLVRMNWINLLYRSVVKKVKHKIMCFTF